jgi:hypothetical protein
VTIAKPTMKKPAPRPRSIVGRRRAARAVKAMGI